MTALELWLGFGVSLAIGLLIGLERERNPNAKAGLRTFALVTLAGTLAARIGVALGDAWLVPIGLAAVAAMLIAAYARERNGDDPGTTTVAAAVVAYLLGALAGIGEAELAGALAILVTTLLYFKPELRGFTSALTRQDLVSALQFLVVTFIVLPILPDQSFGPYQVLNPRNIWLMVVLITGVGMASYLALRLAGARAGMLLTGLLGGLVSSTATTVLYSRRAAESEEMRRVALVVVLLANLVPIARVVVVAAVVAPSLVPTLAPVAGAALLCGLAATAFSMRNIVKQRDLPVPETHNPAEIRTALGFAVLYALVLLISAWLADLAGPRGVYAAALASGMVDIDPAVLSALNLFSMDRLGAREAVAAAGLAFIANNAFKLGVMRWYGGWAMLRSALGPLGAAAAGGVAALALL